MVPAPAMLACVSAIAAAAHAAAAGVCCISTVADERLVHLAAVPCRAGLPASLDNPESHLHVDSLLHQEAKVSGTVLLLFFCGPPHLLPELKAALRDTRCYNTWRSFCTGNTAQQQRVPTNSPGSLFTVFFILSDAFLVPQQSHARFSIGVVGWIHQFTGVARSGGGLCVRIALHHCRDTNFMAMAYIVLLLPLTAGIHKIKGALAKRTFHYMYFQNPKPPG